VLEGHALMELPVDATKSAEQKRLLEIELEAVGIRLNSSKPDVVFKQKAAGGVTVRRRQTWITHRSCSSD
jgi:ribosome-interacting GTPase 1